MAFGGERTGDDKTSFECLLLDEGEWRETNMVVNRTTSELEFLSQGPGWPLLISSGNFRYFVKDAKGVVDDSQQYCVFLIAHVKECAYSRTFVKFTCQQSSVIEQLLNDLHRRKPSHQFILRGLLASGFIKCSLSVSRLWAELDEEVFALYETPTDCFAQNIFFFYTEVSQHVVNNVILDTDSVLTIDYQGGSLKVNLVDEAWRQAFPLVKPRSINCFPYQNRQTERFFLPNPPGHENWEGKRVQLEGRSSTNPSSEDWEESRVQTVLWESELSAYNSCEQLDPDSELGILWAVAEMEMKELIDEGKVPYSSIESGGLDPNSVAHFQKCMNEISEELHKQNFNLAVSHFFGTKRVFSESNNPAVGRFFGGDPLAVIKTIYVQNSIFKGD